MFALLRSLLMGVGRCLAWGVGYAEHCVGEFGRGMWEAFCPPPAPPSDLETVVSMLEQRGAAGTQRAVREAVADAPKPSPVAKPDLQAERVVQEQALRYTTACMYGLDKPPLDGLPEALARRLSRLKTRIEVAPVHRELVRATGRECRDGWWSNRPDEEPGSAAPAPPPMPAFAR